MLYFIGQGSSSLSEPDLIAAESGCIPYLLEIMMIFCLVLGQNWERHSGGKHDETLFPFFLPSPNVYSFPILLSFQASLNNIIKGK